MSWFERMWQHVLRVMNRAAVGENPRLCIGKHALTLTPATARFSTLPEGEGTEDRIDAINFITERTL